VQALKEPTTYAEQIAILKSRGCVIKNEEDSIQRLKLVNYYRLTAYFLPFKDGERYKEGTSFDAVYRLYEFDRKLRGILFSAIEEVEVFLRSQFAYYHAHKYGADGYLQEHSFSERHDHQKFMDNIAREVENNRKSSFVQHHLNNYGGLFPIWVISELFTFGMLSYFYADMKTSDQKYLAASLYSSTPKNVISWLRCCTDLRNICAHYGRLYYRVFPATPAGFNLIESKGRRLWGTMQALKALYPDKNKWNNDILISLQALFEEYRSDINLYHIAFPIDWETQLSF